MNKTTIKERKVANDWVKEHYPDGELLTVKDEHFVSWDMLLEMMVLFNEFKGEEK